MNLKNIIAQRKTARQSEAVTKLESNDKLVDSLVADALVSDWTKEVADQTEQLEALRKVSGIPSEYKTYPRWDFGPVGIAYSFLSTWVYLPDALKEISGLDIPVSAFTTQDLEAWGRLPSCSPMGELRNFDLSTKEPTMEPDLDRVKLVVDKLQAYLGLPCDCLAYPSSEDWTKLARLQAVKAEKKANDINQALSEAEHQSAQGELTFKIPTL